MSETLKGLTVNIYHRPGGDCTNNGASTGHDRALLVGEGIPEVFEDQGDMPVFKLVERVIFGNQYLHVQPVQPGHYMFGGNFVYTSDGRFPNPYPLPIHDRQE